MVDVIEMLFGVWTWVGPRNHTLGGAHIPQGVKEILGVVLSH